jgi:hypothetical protein
MKIRFLTSISDITGWSYDFGEIAEVPDEAAKKFMTQGQAVAVVVRCPHCNGDLSDMTLETATFASAPEQAVLTTGKKR